MGSVLIDVSGPSGGQWTLTRAADRRTLWAGEPLTPTVHVRLTDDAAWKLLFNALPEDEMTRAIRIDGRAELAAPLRRARSVIV